MYAKISQLYFNLSTIPPSLPLSPSPHMYNRKMEEEYRAKRKEMESFQAEEQQQLEERARRQIATLESKLKSVKADEEKAREELKHYREQKEWLDKELDHVQDELVEKNRKIEMLQQVLSEKSEGEGEVDITAQAARIQELERDLANYTDLNHNLLGQHRELSDKVDELKAENEKLRQKVIEEKRKRQRRKSASGVHTGPSGSRGKKQLSERVRKGNRGVPPAVLEGMEAELGEGGEEVVLDVEGVDAAAELAVSGSEVSEELSVAESEDEMVARSSECALGALVLSYGLLCLSLSLSLSLSFPSLMCIYCT